MIRILIDEYKGSNTYYVYVMDDNKQIEAQKHHKFFEAEAMIKHYIQKYNLSGDSLITNNVFDENNYLYMSDFNTIETFLK